MRGRISAEADEIGVPTGLTMWTLGTGFLGGVASTVLSKRAEREGWSSFKTRYLVLGILLASGLNI